MKAIGKVCLLYFPSIETDFYTNQLWEPFLVWPEHSVFVARVGWWWGGVESEVTEKCVGANIWIALNIMCISQD